MNRAFTGLIAACLAMPFAAHADTVPVRLHAAGSLRAAMTDIAKAYSATYGVVVSAVYGGSGDLVSCPADSILAKLDRLTSRISGTGH
jgi:ABC-type molybdate transport system substrate-binding protein